MSVHTKIRGKDRRDRRPTRRPNSLCIHTEAGAGAELNIYTYTCRGVLYNATLCVVLVRVRRLGVGTHRPRFTTIITFYILYYVYCTPQHCYLCACIVRGLIRTPSIDWALQYIVACVMLQDSVLEREWLFTVQNVWTRWTEPKVYLVKN